MKDSVTREQFRAQQQREEEGTEDPNKSNIYTALRSADNIIQNDGSLKELHQQIEDVLEKISHTS